MLRRVVFVALMSFLTVLLSAYAGATSILYSNLTGQLYTGGYWLSGSKIVVNQVMAMPFTPDATMNIADAVLGLSNYVGPGSRVIAYLESDNGGVPGNILDTLSQVGTIPPYTAGAALLTFKCASCPVVDVGTQYWIVALEPNPNTIQLWAFPLPKPSGLVASNETGSATGPWYADTNNVVSAFQVDGGSSPTPESGTIVMLVSALLVAGSGIRRKN